MAARAARMGGVVAMSMTLLASPGTALGATTDAQASSSRSGGSPTIALGDSVMLGAEPCLEERGFVVDAQGSRNVAAIPSALRSQGQLTSIVVVHTGTNGGAERWQFDAVMEEIGKKRQVIFVTVQLPDGTPRYTFEAATNKAIRALPRRYPNAHVADWEALSDKHPEWTGGDGIHLTVAGCRGYARMVTHAKRDVLILTNPYLPMRPLLAERRIRQPAMAALAQVPDPLPRHTTCPDPARRGSSGFMPCSSTGDSLPR